MGTRIKGLRGPVIGFILGVALSSSAAWAAKSVEVTFYRSSTPSVWCYLSETMNWVECIQDPCEQWKQ